VKLGQGSRNESGLCEKAASFPIGADDLSSDDSGNEKRAAIMAIEFAGFAAGPGADFGKPRAQLEILVFRVGRP
jgi:hypothetical protein